MKKTRMTRSFLATVIPTMEIIKIMSTSLYNSLSVAHLISVYNKNPSRAPSHGGEMDKGR